MTQRDDYDEKAEKLVDVWMLARTPAPSLAKRIASALRTAVVEARAKARVETIEECRGVCRAIATKYEIVDMDADGQGGAVYETESSATAAECVAGIDALAAKDKS